MSNSTQNLIDRAYQERREGRLDEAYRLCAKAVRLGRASKSPADLARGLSGLGQIERDRGNYTKALPHYQQAVEIYRQPENPLVLANAVRHLGDLYQELNLLKEAEACYREGLDIFRSVETVSPLALANALRPFAILKEKTERTSEAIDLWKEARVLYEKANIPEGVDECKAHLSQTPRAKS